MAVDNSIYGNSNQWFNAAFQQSEITDKNKIAYFGENAKTLSSGVINNKLSYSEPINKSLSYCGLGAESALSHVAFFGYKDGERKLLEYNDRTVTNFGFFEKSTATNYTTSTFLDITQLDRNVWVDDINTSFNNTGDLSPLTLVNPHNIILFVQVEGKAELSHSWTTVSLGYLPSAISDLNWRYFRRAKVTAYFGSKIDNVSYSPIAGFSPMPANYKPLQISILDKYDCTEKNTSFYMYGGSINNDNTIFGFPASNDISNNNNLLNLAFITENGKEHLKIASNNEGVIEYYDGMIEDIKKTAACFGLYFTGNATAAANGDLTNENMYIGLLDNDGIGRGRYLQGAETANAPQAQNGFKDMHDIPYDYKAIDNTHYQNDTQFYDATLANGFTRFWVLDAAGVNSVLNQMYSIMNEVDPDEPIERYSQKVFLTNNPIDCVISLKKFPLDSVPTLSGAYFVNFGAKATNILAYPLAKACGVYTFTFSSANDTSLYPHFDNSFLDYEPYTKCELVIPFCGSVDIPCCYLYDYGGIEVKLVIDFISGACTAYVLARGITITSVSGNCAIDLPVSGIQSATLDSQIFSAAQAKKQNFTKTRAGLVASALTATAGAVTGNPLMIVAGAAGVLATALSGNETRKSLDYELQHLQTPYKEVSSASGQIAQTYDMRCKMIVTRPKLLTGFTESKYAETVGYSCLYTGEVENFHGLTVGSIELAGVPCTAEEKAYIESMFASGVHLPTEYT